MENMTSRNKQFIERGREGGREGGWQPASVWILRLSFEVLPAGYLEHPSDRHRYWINFISLVLSRLRRTSSVVLEEIFHQLFQSIIHP